MLRPPPRSTLFPTRRSSDLRALDPSRCHAASPHRPASRRRDPSDSAPHSARAPPTPNEVRNPTRSEEHTSELQSRFDLVCRLLLEKKKKKTKNNHSHNHSAL